VYVEWPQREIANNCPCVPRLNIYPSHRMDLVLAIVGANDVELLFVLAGATGRFQPPDRQVSKELKARARTECARRMWRMG
jgi:hypothetical protein